MKTCDVNHLLALHLFDWKVNEKIASRFRPDFKFYDRPDGSTCLDKLQWANSWNGMQEVVIKMAAKGYTFEFRSPGNKGLFRAGFNNHDGVNYQESNDAAVAVGMAALAALGVQL